MGATIQYRIYDGQMSVEKLRDLWEIASREAAYEHGHSYSGDINMLNGEIDFTSGLVVSGEDAASNKLCDLSKKWGRPVAIKFMVGPNIFWMIGGWCAE